MVRSLFVIFIAACLAAAPSAADERDAFTARVSVDQRAQDAVTAREQAIREGRRRALAQVARRLAPRALYRRIDAALSPQASYGPPIPGEVGPAPVTEAEIDVVSQGFEVLNERTSAVRYVAEIDFLFRPEPTQTLFADRDIRLIPPRPSPGLILPILVEGARIAVMEPNGWSAAFEEMLLDRAAAPMTLPVGDLGDRLALRVSPPQSWPDVLELATRYGAQDVVAVEADLLRRDDRVRVRARALRLSPESPPQRLGFERFVSGGAQEVDRLFVRAARALFDEIQDSYKGRAQTIEGEAGVALLDVRTDGLEDWLNVRRALDRSPSVQYVQVLGLLRQGALVEARHAGGLDQFANELRQNGMSAREGAPSQDGTPVLQVTPVIRGPS